MDICTCRICQFEEFYGGGGWNSMHANYTDFNNIEVAIERKEILNYVEDMIKDMKESKWVDNDYNKINQLTFCVYGRLKQIAPEIARKFLKKYKIRISKGYKMAVKELEDKVTMAQTELDMFKKYNTLL